VKHSKENNISKNFGKRLKTVRKQKQLSQEQVAFEADIEISQISRIERGIINTSIVQVYNICKVLGVTLSDLFDFDIEEAN
jgi:transcriptional regulator with XRE-family HTH domain